MTESIQPFFYLQIQSAFTERKRDFKISVFLAEMKDALSLGLLLFLSTINKFAKVRFEI